MVGPVAVKLALPSDWSRVNPTFHVSLVKPYKAPTELHSAARAAGLGPPPEHYEEGEEFYVVDRILDSRQYDRSVRAGRGRKKKVVKAWEYLVR